MLSPKKLTGLAAFAIVVVISALVFYLAYTELSNKQEAFIIIGLVSVLFAILSYLMHAFISQTNVVSGFVWAYYAFGVASLIYATAIIKFSVLYLIIVLVFVLVSLAFIYWRISTTSPKTI